LPVKIEAVPVNLQQAFIAVEDNRFYEHKGVDPRGLLRAIWSNINDRGISEGGSTITQQLAKNAYLTQERTIQRKIQEMFLALKLEKQYTKQEILELYLNQIYFGQGAYGVQAAAKTYFGKNVEELDLAECALLAGIPKSPNYYSPFNSIQAAKDRRSVVLDQMVKYGYIGKMEAADAKLEELNLVQPEQITDNKEAAYFIDYVTQLLIDKYGADAVYKDGLKVYTTIDMDIQKKAEAAVLSNLPNYGVDENGIMQPQAALVAIDPKTGYIKAMIGGRGTDQFNRATLAERQPGSAFKPFVFAAALENDFTPDTVIEDSPITINGWSPRNDNGRFSGSVTMRTVATFSMNVPTVKIAQKIGMDKPIYYAQEMGITTFVLDGDPNDKNFATSLGGLTKGVTPLEITSAYCTFANKGVYVPHTAITKVLDRNGKIIEQADGAGKVVISEESAADLTSMLEDVILRGTGKKAQIGRPAAGKTGTTSNYHDAWFVGYTPDLVVGVWVGKDNNTSTDGIMGGQTPAIIWSSFMKSALADTPVHDFDQLVVKRRSNKKINDLRGDGNSTQNRRRLNNYNSESESTPAASTPAASTNQPASNTDNADSPKPRSSNSNQNYDDSHTQVYTPPSRNNDQTYYEPEPTYREPEPTYREPEPTYREPEPTYREPEPTYREPESTPSSSDSSGVYSEAPPTPGSGVSKSR
ncbi:MAG: PBP1A family penicillin-binding protein, partial [Selenomonadaceae bacterium]|nr:PBP1A family penicillin-binding protein [Selenomonadaceae bacterium]